MALFQLTFVLVAAGDTSGADDASAEASNLARTASDRPESRAVLGAVLLARAQSQLLDDHYRSAMLLAKEAIELYEAGGDSGVEDTWPAQAAAYSVMGRAAFLMEDFETAVTMCQQAVDLVDRQGSPDEGRDLRIESLAVLAGIQFMKAAFSSPDVSGSYNPAVKTAAERMLEEYRKLGRRRTISDVSLSQGLCSYVRACVLDLSRGLEVPDPESTAVPPKRGYRTGAPVRRSVLAGSASLGRGGEPVRRPAFWKRPLRLRGS